jgi:hypothetical protein
MLRNDILIKDETRGGGKHEGELLEKELDGIGRRTLRPMWTGDTQY